MNIPDSMWSHVPGWAAAAIIILGGVVFILSRLAGAYTGVAKVIPIFGRIWHRRAVRSDDAVRLDGELRDLRRIVAFQGKQLDELRNRDEMYWSWILTDQEWHRREEFRAISEQRVLEPHVSFMTFRDAWIVSHPIKEELDF